jgi:hypothetical protein
MTTDLVTQYVLNEGIPGDLAPFISAGQRGQISKRAFELVQDIEGSAFDSIANARKLQKDLAEIEAGVKTGRLTGEQARLLAMNAREEARRFEAHAYAERIRDYEGLAEDLYAELVPTLEPSRESFAREELQLAFGPSERNPEGRALWLATNANDEVVAALLSPYGKTLLQSRGVKAPERILREVRKTVAMRRASKLDTPAAYLLKNHYGGLSAVIGGAGSATRRLAGR